MTTYINLGSRVLQRGLEGTDVELLQNLLKALPEPIGSPIKEHGFFGPETEAAVKKFQKYFGLKVDGIVGENTFLFLGVPTGGYLPVGAGLFGARTLKLGSHGYDVWVLQNRLATTAMKFNEALGRPASGYFDLDTETAVKMFQKDVHLTADGIVGPETVYQIYFYAGMGARYLQKGRWDRDQGYDIYWLQRNLQELSYYTGKLDGKFLNLTEQAVKDLQADKGIKVDGIVGAETYYNLAAY